MNAFTSDLFFNLDHSEAVRNDSKGRFVEYDAAAMLQQAQWFLDALDNIMCCACHNVLPTAAELVADFLRRV